MAQTIEYTYNSGVFDPSLGREDPLEKELATQTSYSFFFIF